MDFKFFFFFSLEFGILIENLKSRFCRFSIDNANKDKIGGEYFFLEFRQNF